MSPIVVTEFIKNLTDSTQWDSSGDLVNSGTLLRNYAF